jgi:hypothetical protein
LLTPPPLPKPKSLELKLKSREPSWAKDLFKKRIVKIIMNRISPFDKFLDIV